MKTAERKLLISLHAEAQESYSKGVRDVSRIVSDENMETLLASGVSPVFLYDCVDDLSRYGEPEMEVFVELAALRILYFRDVLSSKPATEIVPEAALPRKTDAHQGVAWLLRMIRKAQCFLAGSLSQDIMYGCAGDRGFLKEYGASLRDFLVVVRDTAGDPDKVLKFLQSSRST
jgi:hypothetical protein